jgi:hypothetical protein
MDIARTRGLAAGLVLADAALARGLTTASDLDRIAAFMRGWSGAAAARRVAEHASGLRESPIESISFALFVDRCLPSPSATDGSSAKDAIVSARTSCGWRIASSGKPTVG